MTGEDVNSAVKLCGSDAGMAAAYLSTHSLRRGGSQAMSDAGLGDEFRKLFCAWITETHQIYKNPEPERCRGVAKAMWEAENRTGGLRV